QSLGPHQRGEAGAEVDGAAPVGRQEVGVAPDARRPLGDLLPGHGRADGVVVVGRLERPEAPLADVEGRHLVGASAFPATELGYECHDGLPLLWVYSTRSRAPRAGVPLFGCSSVRHWHLMLRPGGLALVAAASTGLSLG